MAGLKEAERDLFQVHQNGYITLAEGVSVTSEMYEQLSAPAKAVIDILRADTGTTHIIHPLRIDDAGQAGRRGSTAWVARAVTGGRSGDTLTVTSSADGGQRYNLNIRVGTRPGVGGAAGVTLVSPELHQRAVAACAANTSCGVDPAISDPSRGSSLVSNESHYFYVSGVASDHADRRVAQARNETLGTNQRHVQVGRASALHHEFGGHGGESVKNGPYWHPPVRVPSPWSDQVTEPRIREIERAAAANSRSR